MSFRPVFIAVVIAFALIVSAFLLNRARPRVETAQPTRSSSAPPANALNATRSNNTRWSTQPIEFVYFDLCHYDGRTSKHAAFMGGADFVQWHGNYPMLARTVELRAQSEALRREHGSPTR